MEHQPIGGILDRLREAGLAPRLPKSSEWPVVDMDRDRLVRFGVDTDKTDNRALIDDALDAYAKWFHVVSLDWR